MRHLAAARWMVTGRAVDVVSVSGGEWLVRDAWKEGDAQVARFEDLEGLWPNTQVVDVMDTMSHDAQGDVHTVYALWILLTDNPEWAQLVLRVWAENYEWRGARA